MKLIKIVNGWSIYKVREGVYEVVRNGGSYTFTAYKTAVAFAARH